MTDARDQAGRDAVLIAALVALDPAGLGGAILRGRGGAYREAWIAMLARLCGPHAPMKRVPLGTGDERLLGGLDLAATLRMGRSVWQPGLLQEADRGFLVLPMAERLMATTAGRIVGVMDVGAIDPLVRSRFGVIALDEGAEPDERPPAALCDRLAFSINLDALDPRRNPQSPFTPLSIEQAGKRLRRVVCDPTLIAAFCETAATFGVPSLRASLFALRATRAIAALEGREATSGTDAALAARLVFAHRATAAPAQEESPQPQPESSGRDRNESPDTGNDDRPEDSATPDSPMSDVVAEAVAAALPAELLAQLLAPDRRTGGPGEQGRGGQARKSVERGRMIGVRRGDLRRGARLALVQTLFAAAPWQRLRRASAAALPAEDRLIVQREDFRIKRFKQQSRTTTVFVVDASGSAALHRLAEAKGAVELLLAECYVRRDEVALIAFRGRDATILLPPTRSLTRAKRCLASLPGGGGTPLAAGLTAASRMVSDIGRKQGAPLLVVLTDGQANVAIDGAGNRAAAEQDALAAAKLLRAHAVAGLLIDTSPRPQPRARTLAETMGARYLPMPASDAKGLSQAIMTRSRR